MIIDCVEFFNELDILELRLETLNPVVDWFVISESTKTHTGLDKPLYFQENYERFKKFAPKVIHQVCDRTPSNDKELIEMQKKDMEQYAIASKLLMNDWWPHDHEAYFRDAFEKEILVYCLKYFEEDDIAIISDVDEIPNPKVIATFEPITFHDCMWNFKLRHHVFYFNVWKEDNWLGGFMSTVGTLRSFPGVNWQRKYRSGSEIGENNLGWHLSFMGGTNSILKKLESYGEQSINTIEIKSDIQGKIDYCLANGIDFLGRHWNYHTIPPEEYKNTLPEFMTENLDRYASYFR